MDKMAWATRSHPLPWETVSQVRSWFDKLTTHGPRHFKNQLVFRPFLIS